MTRTLWIPERSDELAIKIAYAVQAGRVPCLGQYLDEDRAKLTATTLATLHGDPAFKARCVVIEMRTHDDGRIPVARIVDQIGELAAAIILFAMIALVGIGSLCELMA